jgi:DNA-binding transcriptional ArsR family regulator
MASPTSVAPQLLHAIAHPLRLRIFNALDGRSLTLADLAAEVATERRTVGRHLRLMEHAGVVRCAASPRGQIYEAVVAPPFSDSEYGALPTAVRRAAVGVALANIQTSAASALAGRGFDREDIHLTRTTMTVDPEDWQRIADELAEALERIDAIRDESERHPTGDSGMRATAVLMLYQSGPDADAAVQEPADQHAAFSREEALMRAWDLSEELHELLVPGAATDWTAIIDRADQLRVIASAAMVTEPRSREPLAAVPLH